MIRLIKLVFLKASRSVDTEPSEVTIALTDGWKELQILPSLVLSNTIQ